jgi:hypothetical protein
MPVTLRDALTLAKKLKECAPKAFVAPSEGLRAANEFVISQAMVHDTRGYIEKVANQINGSYEKGWYDGCAVMMRRLVETLIIECFECHNITHKIQNPANGEYLYLSDLIDATLNESTAWVLGRNAKKGLPKLKGIGDRSAHSRRFNAFREDIDKCSDDFRVVCQELLYIAKLK